MKIVIAEFSTDKLELVKLRVNNNDAIDKEAGTILYNEQGVQAQYFIDEELSNDNPIMTDLFIKAFDIEFRNMEVEKIIKDLKVFVEDMTPEEVLKLNI